MGETGCEGGIFAIYKLKKELYIELHGGFGKVCSGSGGFGQVCSESGGFAVKTHPILLMLCYQRTSLHPLDKDLRVGNTKQDFRSKYEAIHSFSLTKAQLIGGHKTRYIVGLLKLMSEIVVFLYSWL